MPSWPAAPTGSGTVLPTGGAPEDGGGNPWGWNIAGTVAAAVMQFLSQVAADTSGPVFDLLGRTVLATPRLTSQPEVRALWTACLAAADTGFVLFIVLAGVQLASRDTLQRRYGFKELVPRLLIGMVAANCSLPVIATAIDVANAVTAAVMHEALNGSVTHQAVQQIGTQALHQRNFLESCLALGVIVLGVAVLLSFVARLALLILLIAASPLALACIASPQTAGVALLWCRGVVGLLAIQIAQAVTLVALVRVFLTPRGHLFLGLPADAASLINLLVAATLLWIMCKIPGWVRRLVFRQPVTVLPGRPWLVPRAVSRVVKGLVIAKTLGALGIVGHRAGSHATTARAARAAARRTSPAAGVHSTRTASRAKAAGRAGRSPRSGRVTTAMRPPAGTAGPAAFSHAPTVHIPLPRPTGSTTPAFSHAPGAATSPRPTTVPPAAPVFSQAPRPQPSPPPTARPAPPHFSHAAPPATPPRPPDTTHPRPGPPVFSDAPARHTAPHRPPAPSTPVFSDAPSPAPARRRRTRSRTRSDDPKESE
jgi:hypothetical protein